MVNQELTLATVACGVVGMAALAIIARQLVRMPPGTLLATVVASVALWVVYLQKYVILLQVPSVAYDPHAQPILNDALLDVSTLNKSYELSTVGVVGFSIAVLALSIVRRPGLISPTSEYGARNLSANAVLPLRVFAVLVWLVTSAVTAVFGLSVMGTAGVELPYRLAGLIFYARMILVPLLLVSAETVRMRAGNRISWVFLLLLLCTSITDAILRGSKGSILVSLLIVVLFWLSTWIRGRDILSGKHALACVAVGVVSIAGMRIMGEYRDIRVASGGLNAVEFSDTATNIYGDLGSRGLIAAGAAGLAQRLTGIEQLAVIVKNIESPLWRQYAQLSAEGGVSSYLTRRVYGYGPNVAMGVAPSYFGWWVAMFGSSGAFFGGIALGTIPVLVSVVGLRFFPDLIEVWEIMGVFLFLNVLLEGTIDGAWVPLLVLVGSCIGARYVLRHWQPHTRTTRGNLAPGNYRRPRAAKRPKGEVESV
jgi:hypothetical protein